MMEKFETSKVWPIVGPLMAEADVAISAVNYWFNDDLTALAIAHPIQGFYILC